MTNLGGGFTSEQLEEWGIPVPPGGWVKPAKPEPVRYTLRKYQEEAVETALWHLKNYNKPFIIQAATGAGKSLIIAEICHRLNEPVLILQPSIELLDQNYSKLKSYGIEDIAIYSAGKGQKNIGKFTYATIGSIYKVPEKFKDFKYVIIDECHQVNPQNLDGMYRKFLTSIGAKNVCGLTATPYRLVQKFATVNGMLTYTAHLRMLNRIPPFFFKKIAYKVETDELIKMGYLAPIKYHSDMAKMEKLMINSTGADYTSESLEAWSETRTDRVVEVTAFSASNAKRTLVFCSSIKQAEIALERFSDRMRREKDQDEQSTILRPGTSLAASGASTGAIVTGKTPAKDREQIVADFRAGRINVLFNVGVFTTGFDVPELNSIILARPTMSLSLYYQMVGRGVRLDPNDPNKVLRVFDLANVVSNMGRVETIKLGKEPHKTIQGFEMDTINSEVGRMDETPLFSFQVKKDIFKKG